MLNEWCEFILFALVILYGAWSFLLAALQAFDKQEMEDAGVRRDKQ